MSKPYAEVIGDPIAHSKSPLIHGFWLEKLGIDAEYKACHVRPEELGDYFARRRGDAEWRGCNVTIPHKLSVLQYADERDSSVDAVNAANCIVPRDGKLQAFNTDTDGISQAIPSNDFPVCMIGAGGAARAVMPVLDFWVSAWDLRVIARDPGKAAAALDPSGEYHVEFHTFENASEAVRGARGIINASSLGMAGQPPMPQSVLDAMHLADGNAWVFDMVYSPLETGLLKAARNLDLVTVDGLVMLVGQAKAAFEHFFGVRPPDELDAELRALLTA